jgi:hypothetical protein
MEETLKQSRELSSSPIDLKLFAKYSEGFQLSFSESAAWLQALFRVYIMRGTCLMYIRHYIGIIPVGQGIHSIIASYVE